MPTEQFEEKYREGNLKEYLFWTLAVSFRQTTLGSYILLAKRSGVERITELLDEELLELRTAMGEMEGALLTTNGFKPDRFNYLQRSNIELSTKI